MSEIPHGEMNEVILLAPAATSRAPEILRSARQTMLFQPDFDEDGRVATWDDAADRAATASGCHTLPGVGTKIAWAWPEVVRIVARSDSGPSAHGAVSIHDREQPPPST